MKKNEKHYQTHINRIIKKNGGGFIYKLPDIVYTPKPMDLFGVFDGKIFFIELKVVKNEGFKYSNIRNNQIASFKKIYENLSKEQLRDENIIHGLGIVVVLDGEAQRVVYLPSACFLPDMRVSKGVPLDLLLDKDYCNSLDSKLGIDLRIGEA